MEIFRHDAVGHNDELIAPAHLFENLEKEVSPPRRAQKRQTPMATRRDEVQVAAAVEPLQSSRREKMVGPLFLRSL
jgi:hypothetical protein